MRQQRKQKQNVGGAKTRNPDCRLQKEEKGTLGRQERRQERNKN